eukprot:SAG11_NODE_2361_length_3462_cov_2.031519_1_plen_177_part_00
MARTFLSPGGACRFRGARIFLIQFRQAFEILAKLCPLPGEVDTLVLGEQSVLRCMRLAVSCRLVGEPRRLHISSVSHACCDVCRSGLALLDRLAQPGVMLDFYGRCAEVWPNQRRGRHCLAHLSSAHTSPVDAASKSMLRQKHASKQAVRFMNAHCVLAPLARYGRRGCRRACTAT